MNQIDLKTKPAFKIVILFIIGIIAGRYTEIPLKILVTTSLFITVLSLILFLATKKLKRLKTFVSYIATILIGCLHYHVAEHIVLPNHITHFLGTKESVIVSGYVANYPVVNDSTVCFHVATEIIKPNDSTYVNTSGKILVKCRVPLLSLKKGTEVFLHGKLRLPAGERNPGEFDYRKYLKVQEIYGIIYINQSRYITVMASRKRLGHIDRVISNIREYFENTIDNAFSGQNRAILKGLILGERGEIHPDVRKAFSNIGVMHVLAVSGLHVGYVVLFFSLLFMLLRIPYRLATILTMLSLALYAAMVGFKPPVVRATIIVELYLLGKIIQRQSNPLNLLGTSALIILIINPLELFEASFQLSYAAVLSIFYLYRILNNHYIKSILYQKLTSTRIGNYTAQLFLVSRKWISIFSFQIKPSCVFIT